MRDERGFSDYRVAKLCGIPQSTIYDWRKGLYKPKADKMMKIAGLLQMPLEELIK